MPVSVFGRAIGDFCSDFVTKTHICSKPYQGKTLEKDRLEVKGSGDWQDDLILTLSCLLLFCMNNHGNYFLQGARPPFYPHNRWEKDSESSSALLCKANGRNCHTEIKKNTGI